MDTESAEKIRYGYMQYQVSMNSIQMWILKVSNQGRKLQPNTVSMNSIQMWILKVRRYSFVHGVGICFNELDPNVDTERPRL